MLGYALGIVLCAGVCGAANLSSCKSETIEEANGKITLSSTSGQQCHEWNFVYNRKRTGLVVSLRIAKLQRKSSRQNSFQNITLPDGSKLSSKAARSTCFAYIQNSTKSCSIELAKHAACQKAELSRLMKWPPQLKAELRNYTIEFEYSVADCQTLFTPQAHPEATCGPTQLSNQRGIFALHQGSARKECTWKFNFPQNRTDLILSIKITKMKSSDPDALWNQELTLPDGSVPQIIKNGDTWCGRYVAGLDVCQFNTSISDTCSASATISQNWPPRLKTDIRHFRLHFEYEWNECTEVRELQTQSPTLKTSTSQSEGLSQTNTRIGSYGNVFLYLSIFLGILLVVLLGVWAKSSCGGKKSTPSPPESFIDENPYNEIEDIPSTSVVNDASNTRHQSNSMAFPPTRTAVSTTHSKKNGLQRAENSLEGHDSTLPSLPQRPRNTGSSSHNVESSKEQKNELYHLPAQEAAVAAAGTRELVQNQLYFSNG